MKPDAKKRRMATFAEGYDGESGVVSRPAPVAKGKAAQVPKLSKETAARQQKTKPQKLQEASDDEEIDDVADDESFDSDEGWTAEDEAKWGGTMNTIIQRNRSKSGARPADDDDDESSGESVDDASDGSGASEAGDDDAAGDDGEEQDDGDEDDDEEGVTLMDVLDVQLTKEAQAKAQAMAQGGKAAAAAGAKRGRADDASEDASDSSGKEDAEDDEDQDRDDDEEDDNEEDEDDLPVFTEEQASALRQALDGMGGAAQSSSSEAENRAARRKRVRLAVDGQEAAGGLAEGEFAAGTEAAGGRRAARARAAAAALGLLEATKGGEGGPVADPSSLDTGVDLGSLVSGLAGTALPGMAGLKKRLEKLVGRALPGAGGKGSGPSGPINPVPLALAPSAITVERAERGEAYNSASRQAGKWVDLVQINRRAAHVSYSAEAGLNTRPTATTAAMVSSYTPADEFEAAIAAALTSSGMGAVPGQAVRTAGGKLTSATGGAAVLAAEQAELESSMAGAGRAGTEDALPTAGVDPESVKARLGLLAKMRALLFYDEIKRRRMNRIKSKTYRRLKKRADQRAGRGLIEELKSSDPEAAARLEEEEARIIAKERMSLKHRAGGKGVGGSKWVKRVLARGGGGGQDAATKSALVSHLQRAEELNARIRGDKEARARDEDGDGHSSASDSSDSEEDDYELDEAGVLERAQGKVLGSVKGASEDGTSAIPAKGLFGMRFMRESAARARAAAVEEAQQVASDLGQQAGALRRAARRDDAYDTLKEVVAEGGGFHDEDEDQDGQDHGDDGSEAAGEDVADVDGGRPSAQGSKAKGKATSAPAPEAVPGRMKFGGGAAMAVAKGAGTKGKAADGATGAVISTGDQAITVGSAAPAPGKNAWLSQGGAQVYQKDTTGGKGGSGAGSSSSSNPWLDSGLAGDTSTGVGRAEANKRAVEQAAQAASGAGPIVDVAGALASFEAAVGDKTKAKQAQGQQLSLPKDGRKIDTEAAQPKASASAPAPAQAKSQGRAKRRRDEDSDSGSGSDSDGDSATDGQLGKARGRSGIESEQAELVRRAFVGGGAIDEARDDLARDKDEEARQLAEEVSNAGKGPKRKGDRDTGALAGWGSWAGMGAPAPGAKKAGQPRPGVQSSSVASAALTKGPKGLPAPGKGSITGAARRDSGLTGVLISEKRDKKLSAHQASEVPHPFKSREEYEASLRVPLGREWNTLGATAELTRPEEVSKAGLIIKPLKYKEVQKGQGQAVARAASAAASAGQGKRQTKVRIPAVSGSHTTPIKPGGTRLTR